MEQESNYSQNNINFNGSNDLQVVMLSQQDSMEREEDFQEYKL